MYNNIYNVAAYPCKNILSTYASFQFPSYLMAIIPRSIMVHIPNKTTRAYKRINAHLATRDKAYADVEKEEYNLNNNVPNISNNKNVNAMMAVEFRKFSYISVTKHIKAETVDDMNMIHPTINAQ